MQFDGLEVAKHLREPTTQPLPGGGQGVQIVSVRDQIVISVTGPQLIFEDQSDVQPGSAGKLPDVVHGFLLMLRRQGMERLRAYGWNFDVSFDAPGDVSAASLIAESFIKKDILSRRANIEPKGAGTILFFDQGEARCQLRLEPRFMDLTTPTFWAHINYHYDLSDEGGEMPTLESLRLAYHGLWGTTIDLLDRLVKQ